MNTRLVPLLLALGLSGCFLSRDTVNEPLARERMARVTIGKSTASDVIEALGAPVEVVQLGKRMAWRYDFTTKKTAGFTLIVVSFLNTDQRADRAWMFFDEHDVLIHAGSSYDAHDASYAMPWQKVD